MDGLAACDRPSAGTRNFAQFLAEYADRYRRNYANDVRRNFRSR